RTHVQVQANSDGHWTLADCGSRNGVFIDGVRRDSAVIDNGMAIKLGDPADGIEVRFILGAENDLAQDDDGTTDPAMVAAGAAVRARREELGITQRGLAAAGIVNASALIAIEK